MIMFCSFIEPTFVYMDSNHELGSLCLRGEHFVPCLCSIQIWICVYCLVYGSDGELKPFSYNTYLVLYLHTSFPISSCLIFQNHFTSLFQHLYCYRGALPLGLQVFFVFWAEYPSKPKAISACCKYIQWGFCILTCSCSGMVMKFFVCGSLNNKSHF